MWRVTWAEDCQAAETRVGELEELRGQISRMKLSHDSAINQTTLWAAIQLARSKDPSR